MQRDRGRTGREIEPASSVRSKSISSASGVAQPSSAAFAVLFSEAATENLVRVDGAAVSIGPAVSFSTRTSTFSGGFTVGSSSLMREPGDTEIVPSLNCLWPAFGFASPDGSALSAASDPAGRDSDASSLSIATLAISMPPALSPRTSLTVSCASSTLCGGFSPDSIAMPRASSDPAARITLPASSNRVIGASSDAAAALALRPSPSGNAASSASSLA